MPPLVSVLVPYRDAAPTVSEALRSVLTERQVDLELIAVDDGSKDDGPRCVASLQAVDDRIRMAATGGVGIVGALSLALRLARGTLIARMDADDVCHPGRLPAQLALLSSDERLGVVGTRVEAFPSETVGEGLRCYVAWQNEILGPADHAREMFVESPLCHSSVLIRRTALDAVGGWCDVAWAEDYDLWQRLHAAGWRAAKVPRVLLSWRHHGSQATFRDPRYARERFTEAKAHYLAPVLKRLGRPVTVWGAGPTGRRLARALERHGIHASRFVDIDPRKVGRSARGVAVVAPEALERGAETVVAAVGARGARQLIRGHLVERGFVEGEDFVCAA